MTRQTSIDAYNKIREDGLLGKLQLEVYGLLFDHGPLTQGELWDRFMREHQGHSISPRFAELHALGVIHPIGERACRFSGVNAILWDVTDQLPNERLKKETKEQIIKRLEAQITFLQTRLRIYEPGGQTYLF